MWIWFKQQESRMTGAPNSQNINYKVRVMKGTTGTSFAEEIADIFRNYNIDVLFSE